MISPFHVEQLLTHGKYQQAKDLCLEAPKTYPFLILALQAAVHLKDPQAVEIRQQLLSFPPSTLQTNFASLFKLFSLVPTVRQLSILCLKSEAVGPWGPSTLSSGLPGSEEAVIYLAEELAKSYQVTVYAYPPQTELARLPGSNPEYRYPEQFWTDPNHDVCLYWRQTNFDAVRQKAKKVIYWPHDVCYYDFQPNCDGVFWLSSEQKNQYSSRIPGLKSISSTIGGNGILPEQFQTDSKYSDLKKNRFSCIYGSNYARGLEILLDIWPEIRKEFHEATLDIYYGWQTWGLLNEQDVKRIQGKLDRVSSLGVIDHGKVGHLDLARAYLRSSIWTYPCTGYETFCITATKAQISGCIPVTFRYSALEETVDPDSAWIYRGEDEVNRYKGLLLNKMGKISKMTDEELEAERQKHVKFASHWTWEKTADRVTTLIQELI